MSDIVERLRDFDGDHSWSLRGEAADELERLRERVEKMEDALFKIKQWAEAYPLDIFHEPTKDECRRAHELLTANGMTLDSFSASMARHVVSGVGDIASEAMKDTEGGRQ